MNTLLLAAGFGNRFKPYTNKLAKPAIPLLNLPLIAYPLFLAESLNLKNLIINTHHLPETIAATVGPLVENKSFSTHFSEEQPLILDSAGGIKKAQPFLEGNGHFVVINGDEVILQAHDKGIKPFFDQHAASGALGSLMALPHTSKTRHHGGLWADAQNNIVAIGKVPPQGRDDLICYMFPGVMAFKDELFAHIPAGQPSHIFRDVMLPLLKAGETFKVIVESNAVWFETGILADFLTTTRELLEVLSADASHPNHGYQSFLNKFLKHYLGEPVCPNKFSFLWPGAKIESCVSNDCLYFVGEGSVIEKDVKVSGFCVVGPNLKIPRGCQIESSVIFNDQGLTGRSIVSHEILL